MLVKTMSSPFGGLARTRVLVSLRLLESSFPRELSRVLAVPVPAVSRALAGLEQALDDALAELGFVRRGDRYVHADVAFYLEFPPGPLAIGSDLAVRPAEVTIAGEVALALSPTDSCRDRLAAFYHWRDGQSLQLAVAVARHQAVDLEAIRKWSRAEGSLDTFNEFLREIRRGAQRALVAVEDALPLDSSRPGQGDTPEGLGYPGIGCKWVSYWAVLDSDTIQLIRRPLAWLPGRRRCQAISAPAQ